MTLPESLSYSAAFLVGIAGTPHCIGMCGGIVSLFNLSGSGASAASSEGVLAAEGGGGDRRRGGAGIGYNLVFQLGRASCYALLGAVAGLGGSVLLGERAIVGDIFRWLGLLLLLSIALSVLGWWSPGKKLEQAGSVIWAKVQPAARLLLPANNLPRAYALGLIWGFLPCGLIYSTLAWALTTASAMQAALMMFCFSLGTMPALLGIGHIAGDMKRHMRRPAIRYSLALFLVVLALVPFYMHGQHAKHKADPGGEGSHGHMHH